MVINQISPDDHMILIERCYDWRFSTFEHLRNISLFVSPAQHKDPTCVGLTVVWFSIFSFLFFGFRTPRTDPTVLFRLNK